MPVSKPKKIVPLKKASVKPSVAKAAPAKKVVTKTAAPAKKVVAKKAPLAKPVAKVVAKPTAKVAAKKPVAKKAAPAKPVAKVVAKPTPKVAAKKPVAKKAAPAKPVAKVVAKPTPKVAVKKPVAKKAAPAKPVAKAAAKPTPKIAAKKPIIKKNDKKKIEPKISETKKEASKPSNLVAKSESKKVLPAANKTQKTEPKKAEPAIKEVPNQQKALVRYSDSELELFKIKIVDMRKEAIEELGMLKERLDDLTNYDFAEESMIYSMHMAEQGSEAMEKEKTYAQIQRINEYIKKLDEALDRIKNKSYGVCRVCGCLIAKERLNAVPITTLSASYKIHKKCPDDDIDRIEPVRQ
jgi:RNA polymerase-binding transcription factor DksA